MKQKKPLNLNPFVLIFAVVVVAWLFTFIITPGTLVDGVYTALPCLLYTSDAADE